MTQGNMFAFLGVCMAMTAGTYAATINIDLKAFSGGSAYSGNDGVLSGSGTYWNHSIDEWENMKDESAVASSVDFLRLEYYVSAVSYGGTKIFSGYENYIGFDLSRYGLHDLDPYKTYDVVLYYGLVSGSGKGMGIIYGEVNSSFVGCSNPSDNSLPGTSGRTYLRFNGMKPYEVATNKYGLQVNACTVSSSDQVCLSGIQVKDSGTRTNIAPHFPTPLMPTNGATGIALTPTLTASAFSDPDAGDTHENSQWQVDNSSTFGSREWDSSNTYAASISATVPEGRLSASTKYYWRVRYKDAQGQWSPYSSAISFTTASANGAPTNILLSSTNVAENLAVGSTVGSFSTQDPDAGNTFAYALTNGTGGTDNGSFTISGSNLLTAASFNYEVKSNYSIRVHSTDQGGLSTQRVFAINVTDVNETPTFLGLDVPTGTNVVFRWSSITNHLYTVRCSTNLMTGFSVLKSNITATPVVNTYTDSVQGVPQKFWQITTDP